MGINLNSSDKIYATKYYNFGGVDFSSGAENVYNKHTPTGTNMISDNGGSPKKRNGWQRVINSSEYKIVNMWSFSYHEEEHLMCHLFDGFSYYIARVVNGEYVDFFPVGETVVGFCTATDIDSIFNIITEETIYEYLWDENSETSEFVEVIPYVPLVVYGGSMSGGGTIGDSLNLLTREVRERKLGSSSYTTTDSSGTRDYTKENLIVATHKIDTTKPVKITCRIASIVKGTSSPYTYTIGAVDTGLTSSSGTPAKSIDMTVVYYYNGKTWSTTKTAFAYVDGVYQEVTSYSTTLSGTPSFNSDGISINIPEFTYHPVVDGEDNIELDYYISKTTNFSATVDAFMSCDKTALYENRVWFAGASGDYGNRIWYSSFGGTYTTPIDNSSYKFTSDAYYPELNYIVVGSNDTRVVGIITVDEYLGAVKEPSSSESTIYLIYSTTFDSDTTYACKTHITGVGALGDNTFCNMDNEAIFLGNDGIYGLGSSYIKNRSYYVNKQLFKEDNLENATAVSFKGYYILCVNNKAYIMDSRQKLSWKTEYTNFLYACYYWENIPAIKFVVSDGKLWFAHVDGSLCRFRDDGSTYCFRDDVDTPIYCEWSTPLDDDGSSQLYKTLQKKGTVVTLSPYPKTSGNIHLNVDGTKKIYIGNQSCDCLDFSNVIFDNFTFVSTYSPIDCFVKKKVKKYKRLQFVISNDVIDEPFMIESITKTYTVNGYSKHKSGDGIIIKED